MICNLETNISFKTCFQLRKPNIEPKINVCWNNPLCFHNEISSFHMSNDVSNLNLLFKSDIFRVEFDVYESIICYINMAELIWLGLIPVWEFFRMVSYCEITIRSLSKATSRNTRTRFRKRKSRIICTDHKKEQIAIIAVSESAVSGNFLKIFWWSFVIIYFIFESGDLENW